MSLDLAVTHEPVRYSIVIPLYNERENIVPLYNRLRETMEGLGYSFECVFVDDGSTDGSVSLPLLIFAAVRIVCGVQLVALGLVAEMLVRHFHERSSQSALYNVIGERHRPHDDREPVHNRLATTFPKQ
jgi:hypothetical protein